MSDQHRLYCLGESHTVACCSICWSFLLRTCEAKELRLRKHLMEEAVRPHAHSEVALTDPPEHPVLPSPAKVALMVLVAPSKTHRAHKNSHGHKGGSLKGTASKHSATSPRCDRPDEMSHADPAVPPPKKSRAECKSKHCDPQEHLAPSTPLGPSGLSWPVPCMLPVPHTHSWLSLLTPLAELPLHPVGSATQQGSTGIIQPPMDEPLLLYQLLSSKHFSNWPSRSGTAQCHAP